MVTSMNNVKQTEHLLAEKAQSILEHQQQLELLKKQRRKLRQQKPTASKEHLSYEESIAFSQEVEQYESQLNDLEIRIQKVCRELNGLKKQAKKLLPVSNVKVKVSTYPSSEGPTHTYCVKHIDEDSDDQSEEHFDIEQLQ